MALAFVYDPGVRQVTSHIHPAVFLFPFDLSFSLLAWAGGEY